MEKWNNPDLDWYHKQIGSAQSPWVAENVEGFDQSIKKMLKIIKDGNDSDDGSETSYSKRDQLIALLGELNLKHQLLAERFNHPLGDLHISSKTQKQFAATFAQGFQDYSLLTPDQKVGLQKNERQAVFSDTWVSPGSSTSTDSGKEGSEPVINISSDSDSESCISSPKKGSAPNSVEIMDMETGVPGVELVGLINGEDTNGSPNLGEIEAYDSMLLKITMYEEELEASKRRLLCSRQEVLRLHSELKDALLAVDDLEVKLDEAKNEVKMREYNIDLEKRNVSELQAQVAMLETKVEKLEQENEAATEIVESAGGKLAELEYKIIERDCEIKELNVVMQDARRASDIEIAELQSHKARLSENLTLLEATITERREETKLLEDELKKCQTSKMEMKSLYDAQEIRWHGEIEKLNTQLIDKCELVECLNKVQDVLKLKYDELMAEKDGLNAKAQTLGAELCVAEYNIQQMDIQLHQLKVQNAELMAGSETAMKLQNELGLKVEKLEKEVEMQATLIEDRAEEKREAIRQLCFSLEHYRIGYNELRQAWIGQMRHTVIAS